MSDLRGGQRVDDQADQVDGAGEQVDERESAREAVAAAVAAGRLPLHLDPRERAQMMVEAARRELDLDEAEPGGSHASRAAAYASLAVCERLAAAEFLAEFGPDAFENLYRQVSKGVRSAQRYERVEAAGNRLEAWIERNVVARGDALSERYEQALRKRGR